MKTKKYRADIFCNSCGTNNSSILTIDLGEWAKDCDLNNVTMSCKDCGKRCTAEVREETDHNLSYMGTLQELAKMIDNFNGGNPLCHISLRELVELAIGVNNMYWIEGKDYLFNIKGSLQYIMGEINTEVIKEIARSLRRLETSHEHTFDFKFIRESEKVKGSEKLRIVVLGPSGTILEVFEAMGTPEDKGLYALNCEHKKCYPREEAFSLLEGYARGRWDIEEYWHLTPSFYPEGY